MKYSKLLLLFFALSTQTSKPNNLEAKIDEAYQLLDQNNYSACARLCKNLLKSHKHNLQLRFCYASTLIRRYRFEKAIKQYEHMLTLKSDCAPILYNMGFALKSLSQFERAIPYYKKAIVLDPEHHHAHYGLAQVLLGAGNFQEAWPYFEWRRQNVKNTPGKILENSDIQGKRILIRAEFGLGDTVQFMRYIKLLKKLGAGKIIMQTFDPLIKICSLCEYIDSVVPINAPVPPIDLEIPVLGLPYALSKLQPEIYTQIPYLQPDKELEHTWEQKLASDTNFKVGIVWQAKPHIAIELNPYTKRSIPLKILAKIATIPGVSVYSLQKQFGTEQLNELPPSVQIHDFGDEVDTEHGPFMDTLAIMKQLDVVISVDTVSAHVAGALGVPVWLLLPHAGEWRWMSDCSDSPWYPTMKIYRQPQHDDWGSVVESICHEIEKKISA